MIFMKHKPQFLLAALFVFPAVLAGIAPAFYPNPETYRGLYAAQGVSGNIVVDGVTIKHNMQSVTSISYVTHYNEEQYAYSVLVRSELVCFLKSKESGLYVNGFSVRLSIGGENILAIIPEYMSINNLSRPKTSCFKPDDK